MTSVENPEILTEEKKEELNEQPKEESKEKPSQSTTEGVVQENTTQDNTTQESVAEEIKQEHKEESSQATTEGTTQESTNTENKESEWKYERTRTYERRRRVKPEDLDVHFGSGKQLFIFDSPNYGECSVQMMTNCHKDMNLFYEILFDRHIINEQTAPFLYQATFDETKLTSYSFFKRYTGHSSKGMGLYKIISQEAKFIGIVIMDPECELDQQSEEWLPRSPSFSMYLKPNVHIYHNFWLNGEKYIKEIRQDFIKWFVPRTDFNNFVNATIMALINFSSHPMELELPNSKVKYPFYIFRSYPEIFKVFLGEYAYEDDVDKDEREEKEREAKEKEERETKQKAEEEMKKKMEEEQEKQNSTQETTQQTEKALEEQKEEKQNSKENEINKNEKEPILEKKSNSTEAKTQTNSKQKQKNKNTKKPQNQKKQKRKK